MIPLSFTAPAGDSTPGSTQRVVEYGVQVLDEFGVGAAVPAWGDSLGRTKPVPSRARSLDKLWVWLAEDWRGRMFAAFSKDAAGNVGGPSNAVVVACGKLSHVGADTILWNVSASTPREKRAQWSRASVMNPAVRMVRWTIPWGTWDLTPRFGGDAFSELLKPYGPVIRDDVLQAMGKPPCPCRNWK